MTSSLPPVDGLGFKENIKLWFICVNLLV